MTTQERSSLVKRTIIVDTETTGLNHAEGDRIIEIACVEIIDRRLTGAIFHTYLHTDKAISEEATRVHGITTSMLKEAPPFSAVATDFLEFIEGAELVIHNAPFDVGFIDNELALLSDAAPDPSIKDRLTAHCTITDTLVMARKKHPGARATLDALAKRYQLNVGDRSLHGALLDCEILGAVYLAMTGGQSNLSLESDQNKHATSTPDDNAKTKQPISSRYAELKIVMATPDELQAHQAICGSIGATAFH